MSTTFDFLREILSANPDRTVWKTKDLVVEIGRRYVSSTGREPLDQGTLRVRVHRALRQAQTAGIVQRKRRGLYEVGGTWAHGELVRSAIDRALPAIALGRWKGEVIGLGSGGGGAVFGAVIQRRALSGKVVDRDLIAGLGAVAQCLRKHAGVVVVFSMKSRKGLDGRQELRLPY